MTEATTGEAPVRYCHGCKTYDDAPRIVHIVDENRPDLDQLYHYDGECHEPAVATKGLIVEGTPHEPIVAARKSGKKDGELRAFAVGYAKKIKEAPADKKGAGR